MINHSNLIFFFILFKTSVSFGIQEFEPGSHILEGKIKVVEKQIFFVINTGSHAETAFNLSGDIPKEFIQQNGSNARIEIQLKKRKASKKQEAKFIRVMEFLSPFKEVETY